MKTVLATITCIVVLTTAGISQTVNTIPNVNTTNFNNGWHQFVADFVVFDVEITEGRMRQGAIVWPDRSTYQGYLNGAEIAGRGTYKWPNGMRYEGRFNNNMRHGKGSFILQNNMKWYGKWKNNLKHGKGKIFDAQGKVTKQGVWENDVFITSKQ